MTLHEVIDILQAEVLTSGTDMNIEVERCCSSDLMSDVLAFSEPGGILITGLANDMAIRTAEIASMKAIVFVRGKKPRKEAIDLAVQKKIPLLATKLSMFEVCGRLYGKGMQCQKNVVKP